MAEPLQLKLRTRTRPVQIEDDKGKIEEYEIREMLAGDRDKHLDLLKSRMEKDGDGMVLKRIEGIQTDLLTRSLFKGGRKVPTNIIDGWPSSLVQELYNASRSINRLDQTEEQQKEEQENLKKDPTVTEGSGSESQPG